MLVTETNSPRWQNAIRASRRTSTCLIEGDADLQQWRATPSHSRRDYVLWLHCSAEGVDITCDCEAGEHGQPCKHAARVLCDAGHLRWWSEIVAQRDSRGRPLLRLSDGFQIEPCRTWQDGIEWGTTSGASGRWWLARKLVEVATGDESLVGPLSGLIAERLQTLPYEGWRLPAALLDRWIAEAKHDALVEA